MASRSAAISERDLDALVVFALAANLKHPDAADFGDVGDVRAAAGLQIDARNPQQPHAAGAARRLHAHRLHQLRLGVELGIADPDTLGGGAGGDERSEEHTSELQSLAYLVCRLLLEKKKHNYRYRLLPRG